MDKATKKTLLMKYQDVLPKGAGALFIIQIFSLLGYSVLYSTLILYVTTRFHMSDTKATSITGSFVALNYFLHLIGGFIGGRYLSYRSLFVFAMILQLFGCLLLSIQSTGYLIWGLAIFLGGSGINATCINCMVTQLFAPNDHRRESAFLWNYSGMNIGFLVGYSIGGYFHLYHAYKTLFLISSLGNFIAICITLMNWPALKDRDTAYTFAPHELKHRLSSLGIASVVLLIFLLRVLLEYPSFCTSLIMVCGLGMLIFIGMLAVKESSQTQKNKMIAYLILSFASLTFWTLAQLAPMGLNLFIERNVDRHFLGIIIAPQWLQNLNTLVIIFGAPLLSLLFSRLRERHIQINIPIQFFFALLLIGAGMFSLMFGIQYANAAGYVSFHWVVTYFILSSLGELFISPIGYAMVGQLAPLHLRGLMMGVWMMLTGISAVIADYFSKAALGNSHSTNPLLTNAGFHITFNFLGWSTLLTSMCLLVLTPFISRLIRHKAKLTPV